MTSERVDTSEDQRDGHVLLARMFRYFNTDQRLEILETLLRQATDSETRTMLEGYHTRRGSNGRFVKKAPHPNPSRVSRWERSSVAWQLLEGCFYRYSIKQEKQEDEEVSVKDAGMGSRMNADMDSRMKVNPHMVDGLEVLFEEHGQYLVKLCKCLGLEAGNEFDKL